MAPDAVPGQAGDARSDQDAVSLFHRLNNQLGVILANAELLESKLPDEAQRTRAAQIVSGAVNAIGTVQQLKRALGVPNGNNGKTLG